jgi:hypothetical protein
VNRLRNALELATPPPGVDIGGGIPGFADLQAALQGSGFQGTTVFQPKAPTVNIPTGAMAQGGIVTRPTLSLVAEKGTPEAVIPLNRVGGFGDTYNITVNGGISNSADIGQAVVNAIRAYNRTSGPARISVA